MIVFIDSDYICHTQNDGSMREISSDFFDGKCAAFIEGHRFIPAGESWTRADGVVFHGEMISPAINNEILHRFQAQHEADDFTRLSELSIPQEHNFIATHNYSIGDFIGIFGELYEVICATPQYTSIILGQNVAKTTIQHYLDTLKEDKT